MKNNKGFTLLELLVVIAIIGLISTMAVVSLNSGREKARDSKRLSQVKAVQTAMEFIYDDQGDYDLSACTDTTAPIAIHTCTASGLETYIPRVADLQDPNASTLTGCVDAAADVCQMSFSTLPTSDSQTYTIYIYLEQANSALGTTAAADCTVTPSGVDCS
ncbi:MAG: type II secretion system protein [Candidatus Komeilibacteria bacterium]